MDPNLPATDKRSFVAAIASQYGRRLRRYLAVRPRNAADVPDLAQEVFLRLLRVERRDTIRSPCGGTVDTSVWLCNAGVRADTELERVGISGVYSSTDPTSLLRFLRDQPGIRVLESDREIRITRRSAP